MNDADRKEIQQFIITELEKREGQYIADFFANASEAEKEQIAQDLALFMAQNARGYVKRDTAQPTRYLIDGADINTTVYGSTTVANQAGHAGPTLPNIINLESGFQAKLNARSEANQLDIKVQAGSGADCMFDYLISTCWATEVSAGRGTEGQTFTSLTGCTFKVYSTIQGALNDTETSFVNGEPVVYICGGTYAENVTVPANPDTVHFFGSGTERTLIAPNSGHALSFSSTLDADIRVHNLTLGKQGTATIHGFRGNGTGGNIAAQFNNVHFCGHISAGMLDTQFNHCTFSTGVAMTLQTTAESLQTALLLGNRGLNYDFATNENITADVIWLGNHPGSLAIGESAEGDVIVGNSFTGTDNSLSVKGEITVRYFVVAGNAFEGNAGNQNVRFYGDFASDLIQDLAFVANVFEAPLSTTPGTTSFINSTLTDGVRRALIATNVFGGSGATTLEDGGGHQVKGNFYDSVFGPNSPDTADYSSVTDTGTRSNAFFVLQGAVPNNEWVTAPIIFVTSAPTFSAREGTFAWDKTANTLYINTDGSTTWAVVGVSGSGSAAPSPHDFVGTHHSGDDDYTQTPNVDGIGVGGGDIDVYSDNGVTQTAEIDGTTGHAGLGTTAIANAMLRAAKALSVAGDNYGISLSLTGGADTGGLTGLQFSSQSTLGAGTLALLQGLEATVDQGGAAAVTDLSGATVYVGSSAAGAITRAYGEWLTTSGGWAGAKPATLYGIKIDNLGASGVTLAHGLHVAAQTATTARNVIIDALSLGVDAAVPAGSKLRVDGAVTLDGETAPGTPSADDIVIYNETATDALKAKDDNGVARRLNVDHTVVALIDGATASTTVPFVLAGPMPHAGSIVNIYAKTNENVSIGATDWIGDIHKILSADLATDGQGTTIYTTQANRPTIATMYTAATAPDVTTFAAGDYFAFYTDQAGSGATYITVSMLVRYT